MINYLADRNSFDLPAPPQWWLDGMLSFDPDLVLIPSRFRPVHLLCHRVKYSRGLAPLGIGGTIDPDTQMCIEYHVVPVTWIDCRNWTMGALTYMLDELRSRDTWPHDGAMTEDDLKRAAFEGETNASKLVDAEDARIEAKVNAENHDNIYHASGEAWRYRQHLKGERISSAGPATFIPGTESVQTDTSTMAVGEDSALPSS